MAAKRKSGGRSRKQSPGATELLVLELQAIHNAESQLSRALPRLQKSADSEKLGQSMEQRLAEGERIIQDIEAVFQELDEGAGRRKNLAAEGLINDAQQHVQEIQSGPSLDAVLIAAIQKTEHYCIAAWGTARSLAQTLGQKTAAKAMDRALKEGGSFDERLTQLAEREITPALMEQEEDSEGEESAGGNGGASRRGRQGRNAGSGRASAS
jgi:ferritin-like metal-binding protein YciE